MNDFEIHKDEYVARGEFRQKIAKMFINFGCSITNYYNGDKISDDIEDMNYDSIDACWNVRFLNNRFCLVFVECYNDKRHIACEFRQIDEKLLYKNIDKFKRTELNYYEISYLDLKEILFKGSADE